MSPVERLPADALYLRTDPRHLDFATTADLTPSDQPAGQPRAVAAVRFGVAVRDQGYHIFALGPNGTGKRHFLTGFLTTEAATRPLPGDLVDLNDFEDPSRPIAVRLPPGRAVALRTDMLRLVQEVSVALPAAFEAEEYHTRLRAIEEAFKADTAGRLEELRQRAAAERIAMVQTPEGKLFAPTRAGEALGPDAVAEGRFHVYPVATVDHCAELLMGVAIGERDAAGRFPPAASVRGCRRGWPASRRRGRRRRGAASARTGREFEGDSTVTVPSCRCATAHARPRHGATVGSIRPSPHTVDDAWLSSSRSPRSRSD